MPNYSCHAKINIALSVGRPRSAGGYHPLCSWMVRVSLADDLLLERAAGSSSFNVEWAADAPCPSPIDWPLNEDLSVRAHHILESRSGRSLGVRATLRKRIPVGSGMGGASSDAAAMLAALDGLFELRTGNDALKGLAAGLGSDIPFFLGAPAAVVSGVGEEVEDVAIGPPLHLALILPPLRCNTGAVYRAYDRLRPDAALDEAAVRRLIHLRPLPPDSPFNDLTQASFVVEPRLRRLHDSCEQRLGRPVHVTGSGAAMFVVAESAASAGAVADEIRALGTTSIAVTTL